MFLIIAIQIFNVSIDPADDFEGAKDISINEIESCIEFVLEVVLDRKNAIEECDEPDESSDRNSHITVLLFFPNTKNFISERAPTLDDAKPLIHNSSSVVAPTLSVTSPPPKQA
jgi:hypothetical protein